MESTIVDSTKHVNITTARYIQLLEAENGLFRIQSQLSSVKPDTKPAPVAPTTPAQTDVKPYVPPFNKSACDLTETTQRIHASGTTLKQWARSNGFRPGSVSSVVCGNWNSKTIIAALIRDGFMEAAP